ncbi:PTS sugar transporter subunit IIA [Streptococcus marmotae]|uniref:PTS sugar transporter subunit IIA n=1 Tax=Streptococcus marmotae TaxID=1825069 RepID=UPI000834288B|nr:hypothetical protein [Streptococcus marmotae]
MTHFIIATHERLSEGFKHTLEYIAPNSIKLSTIAAYVHNIPVEEELVNLLEEIGKDEQVLILTDLLGGSVNQECAKFLHRENVHVITGLNFPLLLSLAIEAAEGEVSAEKIRQHILEAREQIIYVNDYLARPVLDFDDE